MTQEHHEQENLDGEQRKEQVEQPELSEAAPQEGAPAERTSEEDSPEPHTAEQDDSDEMSLETLETHIQEAEELHHSLSRRLDVTSRD